MTIHQDVSQASALAAELKAAADFLARYRDPCAGTRAEIRALIGRANDLPPVRRAMTGYLVRVQREKPGRAPSPSDDGHAELIVFNALVKRIEDMLDAADKRGPGRAVAARTVH